MFVFGDFKVHQKDWLTCFGGTNRPGELCYKFSLSNDLTQMVNYPTRVPDCESHNPALLDLFISSDAIISSRMAFPPLGNSDHVVSVSIARIAYDYSRADWDGLRDHLRDVHGRISLNSVLLLLLVVFASGFRLKLKYISLIINVRPGVTHLHGFQLLMLL